MREAIVGLSLSPTWWRGDAWRAEGSRIEGLASGEALIDAAVLADGAGAHFAFKPDPLELDPAVLGAWPGQTGPDPVVLMAAIARETTGIGLVPTYSTTFAPPYLAARELQTLDQISGGRAGWNAVTSLGGHRNFGGPELPSAARYARAAEMIGAVRALHASYPAAAVRADRDGVYADARMIRELRPGEEFAVRGPLTTPAAVDEPMPLLHAGGSPASLALAASHADAVFAMTAEAEAGRELRAALAERAAAHGRTPPRVLPGLILCLAETRAEAMRRYEAAMAGRGGGAAHWTIVGTPDGASAEIEARMVDGGSDGFVALPFGSWQAVELFAGELMPRLRRRGVLAERGATLRGSLRA